MQVTNNSLTNVMYKKYRQGAMVNMNYSEFYQMLRSVDHDGTFTSPQMQLLFDYENWKAARPERHLPDSQGATEENMAYLKEHFSGNLDIFQKVDAYDTMVEMGIMTKREMLEAIGFGPVELVSAGNVKIVANGSPEDARARMVSEYTAEWSNFFSTASIMQSDSLEELFKLLDEQLENAKEKDAAQEIKDVLEQVARRSFGASWAMV